MRRRRLFVGLMCMAALAIAVPVIGQASDSWVGTWRLNLAKSKYDPISLAPKTQTVILEPWEGGMKAVTDGFDVLGKPTHTETRAKFDNKEYDVTGAADPKSTRIYRRIDSRTYEFTNKVGGKVTTTVRSVVSADGKTRTVTTTGTNAQNQTVNNLAFYDRQ